MSWCRDALALLYCMKDYAISFYKSIEWKKCRASYAKSVGMMCERCAKQGRVTPGAIVHHIKHITPDNIGDPLITLDWSNLELVCRECHARAHSGKAQRFKVDEYGNVTAVDEC